MKPITLAPMSAEAAAADTDPYASFLQQLVKFTESPDLAPLKEAVRTNQKMSRKEYSAWQKALFAKGWAAPNWPVEYGGTGWDLQQRYLFEEVTAAADCPPQYHHGIGHIGPVIMHFGSDEIKKVIPNPARGLTSRRSNQPLCGTVTTTYSMGRKSGPPMRTKPT
jgi:alkylation response protein AidB-like acyl-CoA dehydrogenase